MVINDTVRFIFRELKCVWNVYEYKNEPSHANFVVNAYESSEC